MRREDGILEKYRWLLIRAEKTGHTEGFLEDVSLAEFEQVFLFEIRQARAEGKNTTLDWPWSPG